MSGSINELIVKFLKFLFGRLHVVNVIYKKKKIAIYFDNFLKKILISKSHVSSKAKNFKINILYI